MAFAPAGALVFPDAGAAPPDAAVGDVTEPGEAGSGDVPAGDGDWPVVGDCVGDWSGAPSGDGDDVGWCVGVAVGLGDDVGVCVGVPVGPVVGEEVGDEPVPGLLYEVDPEGWVGGRTKIQSANTAANRADSTIVEIRGRPNRRARGSSSASSTASFTAPDEEDGEDERRRDARLMTRPRRTRRTPSRPRR